MDRKLKLVMLLLWSIIAILLTALLIFGIVSNKNGGSIFPIFHIGDIKTQVQKQENISLNNLDTINMDFSSENIIISPTEDDQIRVVESSSGTLSENQKFTISKEGNGVTIKQGNPKISINIFNLGNFNRKIELFIPKSYKNNLELSLSSGNVIINNDLTVSNFTARQSSGNVECKGSLTAQEVNIENNSGNITINSLNTKAYTIQVTSGNIRVESLSGSGTVKATSGNVNIAYKDILEYSNLSVTSGNIKLTLPKDLSFEFEGSSSSGNINSDFPLTYRNNDKKHVTAKVGSGPYKNINANVSSGNINIY